jgi:hypothetical protein
MASNGWASVASVTLAPLVFGDVEALKERLIEEASGGRLAC